MLVLNNIKGAESSTKTIKKGFIVLEKAGQKMLWQGLAQ